MKKKHNIYIYREIHPNSYIYIYISTYTYTCTQSNRHIKYIEYIIYTVSIPNTIYIYIQHTTINHIPIYHLYTYTNT